MDIEIVGRHALLFDDDTTAAFVNSEDALVEWNSLLIDRYDVRHLLSSPPPSRRRRNPQTSHLSTGDAEIDYERYLDLPSPSEEQEAGVQPEPVGGFNAVPFSYDKYEDSNDQKNVLTESDRPGFYPPFPVPDSLVKNLPPTEKLHQIIARTAIFVSKNGGQSEIILRVKQGDNPTFGFLMPDHHLHAYFRFLVDHQDLLLSKEQGAEIEEKTPNTSNSAVAGALSLLGSAYGTGEDEDVVQEHESSSRERVSDNTLDVDAATTLALGKTVSPAGKDAVKMLSLQPKEDASILKRSSIPIALKAGRTSVMRKGESSSGSIPANPDKLRASSLPPIPKAENMLLDPPSDMKRLVDKIVEFIIKNGRQFEAVLMEQDRDHGRFPFLIPSNKFHHYYLKVLQKTEELKLTMKGFHNEKEDFRGHLSNKKISENSMLKSEDIPLDSERKEKFKMIINKSKKEGSDLPAKSTEQPLNVQVDAAQAAAILQAATRGIKHPDLGILSNSSLNGNKSSNSPEPHLIHEQKLKAERLKRAKMFVAMLKSGSAPKPDPSRGSSTEPQERERTTITTAPSDDILDKKLKSEKDYLNEEKRAKRKYRPRSSIDEEPEGSEEQDNDETENGKKSLRKKHRSHKHSDEKYGDEKYSREKKKKHRSRSSFDDDERESQREYSRKKHRSNYSSVDEEESVEECSRKKHAEDDRHYRRKHRSHRHKHRRSHSSRHKDDKETEKEKEKEKHGKGSVSEREELEDGEISSKFSGPLVDGVSREASVDVSSSYQDRRPSQPAETTDVPDELRAKIRAMLMSTL